MKEVQYILDTREWVLENEHRANTPVVSFSSSNAALFAATSATSIANSPHGNEANVLPSSGVVALTYVKYLCHVLSYISDNGAVGKIRNNCMRLCGISPFSPQADYKFSNDADCRLQRIICPFCTHTIVLDLSSGIAIAKQQQQQQQHHPNVSSSSSSFRQS